MNTYEKARTYLYRNARPLDLARFQFHFEKGSRENVMNVLSCYQNADGGCGHAVEADCWNPNSTPLHSGTATDIIREIDYPDANHPLIKGLLRYFTSGKDFDGSHWALMVESNNGYPHAPWWHTDSISSCHTDYNGTAQIAGFLIRYAEQGSDVRNLGIRIAGEAIDTLSPDELLDMHTCGCYIQMAECIEKAGVTDQIAYIMLKEKLHASVKKLIERDVSKWGSYICKPSQFFNTNQSEFYPENKEIADYECEHIIKTQLADGSWDIPWSWGDFPEEWAVAKRWWKGHVIVQNLLYLKGMGRLKE